MTVSVWVWVIALAAFLALSGTAGAGSPGAAPASDAVPVRVVYTADVLRDIAESDAKAAIKVWADTMAKEKAIHAYAEVEIVPDAEGLARLLETKHADVGGMTMLEFHQIEDRVDIDPIFAVSRGGTYAVEYLVLVRNESSFRELTDLRGATLALFDNARGSLAMPWVELILAEHGIGSAADFFGRVSLSAKLSAVVLPVFFGKADACLVTRSGFETMVELNPQVGRDLRVLAKSPGLIPMVAFIRGDFSPPFRQDLITAMVDLGESAAGRQVLTLLQGDSMVVVPSDALNSTRELMQKWSRRGARSSAHTTPGGAPARARDTRTVATEKTPISGRDYPGQER